MVEQGDFRWLITVGLHTFWLVDNYHMFILIKFLHHVRLSQRNTFFRIVFLVKSQFEQITCGNGALPVYQLTVDTDVFLGAEEMADFSRNKKIIFQDFLNRELWKCLGNANVNFHLTDW